MMITTKIEQRLQTKVQETSTKHYDMIELLNKILDHERGHFDFYFNAAVKVKGVNRFYYKPLFEKEMMSELDHMKAFADKVTSLGGRASLGMRNYWSNSYELSKPEEILQAAIDMERQILKLYHDVYPLAQEYTTSLGDASIQLLLEENIEHTTADVEEMEKLI